MKTCRKCGENLVRSNHGDSGASGTGDASGDSGDNETVSSAARDSGTKCNGTMSHNESAIDILQVFVLECARTSAVSISIFLWTQLIFWELGGGVNRGSECEQCTCYSKKLLKVKLFESECNLIVHNQSVDIFHFPPHSCKISGSAVWNGIL